MMRLARRRRGTVEPRRCRETVRAIRFVLVLPFGVWLAAPALAQLAATEPAAWLTEAEQHFAAGNQLAGAGRAAEAEEQFRAALLRYERAAEALGRGNGFLLYNIGNTYLRLGDLGHAVLHYREAQRLIPADPNLQQSLRHARALRRDRITADAAGSVFRVLFFWHDRWPLRARVTVFLVAANILWLRALFPALNAIVGTAFGSMRGPFAALGRRLAGRGKWQRARQRAAVTVVVIAGLITAATGGSAVAQLLNPGPEVAVIVAPEVTARRGDSEAYEPSFATPLHAGTELLVIAERNQWFQVALADGRRSWLPAHAVAVVAR